jgi:hypothetical protein
LYLEAEAITPAFDYPPNFDMEAQDFWGAFEPSSGGFQDDFADLFGFSNFDTYDFSTFDSFNTFDPKPPSSELRSGALAMAPSASDCGTLDVSIISSISPALTTQPSTGLELKPMSQHANNPVEQQEDQESRLRQTEDTVSHNHQGSKRKWEDGILVFGANEGNEIARRKRKAFSQSRKKEVALNRRIGVCIRCKIGKLSVSISY